MKLIENFISFTIVIVISGLLISIFTAQEKQRRIFDEQTVQKASKKKTSAEKRVERERPSIESINGSLDAKEEAQNSENNTAEKTQANSIEGND